MLDMTPFPSFTAQNATFNQGAIATYTTELSAAVAQVEALKVEGDLRSTINVGVRDILTEDTKKFFEGTKESNALLNIRMRGKNAEDLISSFIAVGVERALQQNGALASAPLARDFALARVEELTIEFKSNLQKLTDVLQTLIKSKLESDADDLWSDEPVHKLYRLHVSSSAKDRSRAGIFISGGVEKYLENFLRSQSIDVLLDILLVKAARSVAIDLAEASN
ncbi:hypothetical protein RQP46_010565 [Phenoliferia psychrophenolica]